MNAIRTSAFHSAGFTLLEVLVAIVILAFGLLGIASLQVKLHTSQVESYQRSQAILLIGDLTGRMTSRVGSAATYVTGTDNPLGTGDAQPADCTDGSLTEVERDQCEWSALLKGAAEESTGGQSVGAMIGARGCVEQLQAEDTTAGVCQPGIYRVTVAWQGLVETAAPPDNLNCADGLYGDETFRRVVTSTLTIGLPRCS